MRTSELRGRLVSAASRKARGAYVPLRTADWPVASRLFFVGDGVGWALDDLATRLSSTARRLGYEVGPERWAEFARRQSVFVTEHFRALQSGWLASSHRLGLAYLHGRPGTPGYPEFDRTYELLRRNARRFDRVQVTHAEMHELVVEAGIDPADVFRIPIGIDISRFLFRDGDARTHARAVLELPESAFVVGSFQKDGVGWGEGLEPKLIKGPDVLVAMLARLQETIPDLFVLLTGPARGYVRRELTKLQVPYLHRYVSTRAELGRLYHALDVYVVTARQEGGPESVLESMATGAPLVSTRVGQAQELVVEGENGLLVDVDDLDALVNAVQRVHDDSALVEQLRAAGRPTAEAWTDERLDPRWAELLDGFVQKDGPDAN